MNLPQGRLFGKLIAAGDAAASAAVVLFWNEYESILVLLWSDGICCHKRCHFRMNPIIETFYE
jgi:hypothetical protein